VTGTSIEDHDARLDAGLDARAEPLRTAAIAIGGATALSGLGLIIAPRQVLWMLGAGRSEPAPFLFRIIGMFMAVSGGLLMDGARPRPTPANGAGRVALRWAMVAKIGAAIAIGVGVRSKRFGKQGLALAAFDASAAVAIAAVMRTEA
jgi:hypothetical protein